VDAELIKVSVQINWGDCFYMGKVSILRYLGEDMSLSEDSLFELVEYDLGCTRDEFNHAYAEVIKAYTK
jgi:hypothetical protein